MMKRILVLMVVVCLTSPPGPLSIGEAGIKAVTSQGLSLTVVRTNHQWQPQSPSPCGEEFRVRCQNITPHLLPDLFLRIWIEILSRRAEIQALDFDYDAAIAGMDRAIALAEGMPDYGASGLAALYTQRGQMILLLYEWDRVLDDYNRAITLDPDYAEAYYHRGILFYTQGPRENALDDFERYLELAPVGAYAEDAAIYREEIAAEREALER